MDKHYLGTFSNLDEVFDIYPSGGSYGDYIILDRKLVWWNDHQRIWGEYSGFEPISDVETQDVDGNLHVTHNIRAGGIVKAKEGVFDKISCNEVDFSNNPFALSDHKHIEYADKRHKHNLADIKDLSDYVDDALNESGFSLIKMWQALDAATDHQINLSHLTDIIDTLKGAYLSRKNDDFAEGNITFRKKIEVYERAIFRNGATFISEGLPEEIHSAIVEPDISYFDDYILEESVNMETVASGYVEK